MLKYWPFKKIYLFVTCAVLMALAGYWFAIKNTLEAWNINRQLSSQLTKSSDISYDPAYLERKNINLDKIIKRYQADTIAFRSNIISSIAVLAQENNIRLTDVPLQDAGYHTDKYIIQKLTFEGDFFALNRFLNQLENQEGVGEARAAEFRLVEQRITGDGVKKLAMGIWMEVAVK